LGDLWAADMAAILLSLFVGIRQIKKINKPSKWDILLDTIERKLRKLLEH